MHSVTCLLQSSCANFQKFGGQLLHPVLWYPLKTHPACNMHPLPARHATGSGCSSRAGLTYLPLAAAASILKYLKPAIQNSQQARMHLRETVHVQTGQLTNRRCFTNAMLQLMACCVFKQQTAKTKTARNSRAA